MQPTIATELPVVLPWYRHLYVQVLIAITLGALLGHFAPGTGEAMKPLGDAFIKLVKMIIAPVIFLTIVTGIAGMLIVKINSVNTPPLLLAFRQPVKSRASPKAGGK